MEKIILEIEAYPRLDVDIKSFSQELVSIGRSFNNDVIFHDPYIAPLHLTINQRDGIFYIQNHSLINGAYYANKNDQNTRFKIEGEVELSSGMFIFIGKSQIRFWLSNEPILPELPLETTEVEKSTKTKSLAPLFGWLTVLTLIEAFDFYTSFWSNQNFLYSFLLKFIGFLICFILWAGFWSIISKFIKKKARYLEHLYITLRWFVIMNVIEAVIRLLSFFICNITFDRFLSEITTLVFVFYVLNVHLRLSTNLSRRNRYLIALTFVTIVLLITLLTFLNTAHVFSPYYKHYFNLLPIPAGLIPTISIDQYLHKIIKIF